MTTISYNPTQILRDRQETYYALLVLFFMGVFVGTLYVSPTIGFYLILSVTVFAGIITAFFSHGLSIFVLVFMIFIRLSDVAVHEFDFPSILQPMIIAIMGITVVRFIATGQKIQGWVRVLFPIALYSISLLISSFFADDFDRAFAVLMDFIPNILIALFIVVMVQRKEDNRIAIYGLIAAGIFLGTISVIQVGFDFYAHDFAGFGLMDFMNIVGETDSNRIGGSLGDPNMYAQVMLVIIPIAFDRLINEKKFLYKLIALWGFMASLLTVIFTYSRGAFVALVLMVVFYVIYRKIPLKFILLSILILLLLIPFLPANYIDRIVTIPQSIPFLSSSFEEEVSYSGRWSEMYASVLMFLDHPLIGVGVNNYKYHYLDYARRIGTDLRGIERNPHILYLQILAEQGFLGILTFGFVIFMMFREFMSAIKAYYRSKDFQQAFMTEAIMISFFGWLIAAFFLHLSYPRYFWLLYGIAYAMNKLVVLYPYDYGYTLEGKDEFK